MEIKLSQIVNDMEDDFYFYAKEAYDDLAIRIKDKLGLDVYEANETDDSIYAICNSQWIFLDKIKDAYYSVLEDTDFKIPDIEFNYILSFMLTCSRKRSNLDFIKDILIKQGIINSYTEKNGNITIESKYGTVLFRRALDEFKDEDLEKYLENISIEDGCHEIAEYLLSKYDNYKAVTAIAVKNICEEYFHSFILDGNTVIDIPNNIIMDKDTYYELFMIEELNTVNYKEYLEESNESKKYDESNTLFGLLRNAIYKKVKEENLFKK
jgi:hypothetical protein